MREEAASTARPSALMVRNKGDGNWTWIADGGNTTEDLLRYARDVIEAKSPWFDACMLLSDPNQGPALATMMNAEIAEQRRMVDFGQQP